MPKINRKYYVRAKEITNASINNVSKSNCDFLSLNSNTSSSISSTNDVSSSTNDVSSGTNDVSSLVLERDAHKYDLNKKLDKNILLTHTINYELINNNEEALESENNNDADDINEDGAINRNFLDNFERRKDNNVSFTSQLQGWAIRNRITHVALNELMAYIKPKYPELPRDARTLLGTVRKVHADDIEARRYYHFGINYFVEKLVETYSFENLQIIEIIININGLPLSKSSGSQVYPILCNLVNNYSNVGIIGIYHGYEKPADANKFLQSFVKEAQDLITNGITINGIIYPFKIRAFVCDVPAQSFVKYTKGHSGYYSCTKCETKGEYYLNRVCFPYLEISNIKTNKKFRLKSQPDHHTGTSILELIPDIDMVFDFPSDPMHLLYLGEVKKIVVFLWCHGKPPAKLSSQQQSIISTFLEKQRYNIPCDFNRKPRSLLESKRWKATEYKTFLLYIEPVIKICIK